MSYTLHLGDCLELARGIQAHAIVVDPPYELGFMNAAFDKTGISFNPETWKVLLDCVPPGGHMLCFGGSRTFHRIAVAIEDAGWELRDTICWLYGSGMPHGHSVALGIDKQFGHKDRGHRIATASRYHPDGTFEPNGEHLPAYEARSPEAKYWEGWGSALKPAWEPVLLCRRPLDGTIASNVLKHGVGGLNVDAGRIGVKADDQNQNTHTRPERERTGQRVYGAMKTMGPQLNLNHALGRWPANVILDEEAAAEMDAKYMSNRSRVGVRCIGASG